MLTETNTLAISAVTVTNTLAQTAQMRNPLDDPAANPTATISPTTMAASKYLPAIFAKS